MLADLFDAINANTRVTMSFGSKKVPKQDVYPRPKSVSKSEKKKAVTVMDLFKRFTGVDHPSTQ